MAKVGRTTKFGHQCVLRAQGRGPGKSIGEQLVCFCLVSMHTMLTTLTHALPGLLTAWQLAIYTCHVATTLFLFRDLCDSLSGFFGMAGRGVGRRICCGEGCWPVN